MMIPPPDLHRRGRPVCRPAGMAGTKSVQGAYLVVPSLTRSIRSIVPIDLVGDGSPVPAGMAGFIFVQGALRVVTTFAAR